MKHSPIKQNGITFRGNTQWYINPYNKIRQLNNLYYYDNISATVDITFTMPRWVDYRRANWDEQRRWDVFYKALLDHEDGHKDIAVATAKKLCQTLAELESDIGKAALMKKGYSRAKEIYKECKILNQQFDIETEHGRKTGAILR